MFIYNDILFAMVPNHGTLAISQCGIAIDSGGIIKPLIEYQNYHTLNLSSHRYNPFVHRLVWQTWVGYPGRNCIVYHADGDKSNNDLSNLRVRTPSDRIIYPPKKINTKSHHILKSKNHTVRVYEATKREKLTLADVEKIRELAKNTDITQQQLAAEYHVCRATINRIINNKTWNMYKKQ